MVLKLTNRIVKILRGEAVESELPEDISQVEVLSRTAQAAPALSPVVAPAPSSGRRKKQKEPQPSRLPVAAATHPYYVSGDTHTFSKELIQAGYRWDLVDHVWRIADKSIHDKCKTMYGSETVLFHDGRADRRNRKGNVCMNTNKRLHS